MEGIDTRFIDHFEDLPSEPPLSLRGANALDEYKAVPEYDPIVDEISPDYLEAFFLGISHLDAVSWRYYLPYLLGYSVQNIRNPNSHAVDAFLSNLRPPDREPPWFSLLSSAEKNVIVSVLDKLAFSDESEWQEQAIVALEEYWAPGALYR